MGSISHTTTLAPAFFMAEAHPLPTSPFIGTRFESIEKDGEIEEFMSLDYSRLTVAFLGGLKHLTNRVAQLESQLT